MVKFVAQATLANQNSPTTHYDAFENSLPVLAVQEPVFLATSFAIEAKLDTTEKSKEGDLILSQ